MPLQSHRPENPGFHLTQKPVKENRLPVGAGKVAKNLYIERIAEMKEIVNVVLKGRFYCDRKDLFFHDAEKAVTKKLAALVGSRLVRDGELRFSVVDNQAEEGRP